MFVCLEKRKKSRMLYRLYDHTLKIVVLIGDFPSIN